ncbi:MAG: InlB B-repeat-containing protein [Clostridium sp.]|nr:InlB B-repeat-containing protein [Clostridium sp.]
MKDNSWKKVLAKVLAAVMIFSILPFGILADGSVSVLDGQVTIDYAGTNATASADNDVVTASASVAVTSGCPGDTYNSTTNTLTVTNRSDSTKILSFNYELTLNGGSCTIDNSSVESGSSFSKELSAGESFTIILTCAAVKDAVTTIVLKDFALNSADQILNIRFEAPVEGGTISVNGVSSDSWTDGVYAVETTYSEGVSVTASPEAGYEFYFWLDDENSIVTIGDDDILHPTGDMTIHALFIAAASSEPWFQVGTKVFMAWGDAVREADQGTSKTIVPLRSGVLKAGEYNIPSGVTLLIPFDSAYSLYTDKPEVVTSTLVTPSLYRKLTLASGAVIKVDGAISVSAKHKAGAGSQKMSVYGKYGQIDMQEGSRIVLSNGSKLYAWGYITGAGEVEALAGADVYEYFQLTDFRGGSACIKMNGNSQKVFPMSSYYVQNIETRLIIHHGAREIGFTTLFASNQTISAAPIFIGEGGLFQLSGNEKQIDASCIVKYYDPIADKLHIEVYGDSAINSLTLTVLGFEINSSSYILPINNMVIELKEGTLTTDQKLELTPDSGLIIGENATLDLVNGGELYVVAIDEWGAYTWGDSSNGNWVSTVVYSPSWANGSCPRNRANMASAFMTVNGTANVSGVLATSVNASVTSTGAGHILFNTPAGSGALYGYNQSSGEYIQIPTNSARLENSDASLVDTNDAVAGDFYDYVNGTWFKNGALPVFTVTFKDWDGSVLYEQQVSYGQAASAPSDPERTGYTFTGWDVDFTSITGDLVVTAQYSINRYTITYKVNGAIYHVDTYAYGESIILPDYTPAAAHDFSGWEGVPSTMPASDLEFDAADELWSLTFSASVVEMYPRGTVRIAVRIDSDHYEAHTMNARLSYDPTKLSLVPGSFVNGPIIKNGMFFSADAISDGVISFGIICPGSGLTESGVLFYFDMIVTDETAVGEVIPLSFNLVEHACYAPINLNTPVYLDDSAVNGSVTVIAAPVYTINFVNYDGSLLYTTTAAYGYTPEYVGDTPTREADAQYTYTFAGWSPTIGAADANATYTATYTEVIREYTITYYVNGEIYTTESYAYGAAVAAPTYAPEVGPTYFTFSGWTVPDTMPAENLSVYATAAPFEGINELDGDLYLFANGEIVEYPGLVRIEVTDDNGSVIDVCYYYFGEDSKAFKPYTGENGELVNECLVEKNNDMLFAGDKYIFDENGVIVHDDFNLNGICELNGKLFYCIDGVIIRHGLVRVDGRLYYARSVSGELVTGCRYWVTRTNGLTFEDGTPIAPGYYYFDDNGVMFIKNGIVEENGSLYYYVNNVLTPAGLIKLGDDYYYVRTSNSEVIHGRSYWVTVTNGLLPSGMYEFDTDGKMIDPPVFDPDQPEPEVKDGIVEEFGSLYYYVDGVLTPAGLIELDGSYYYVRTSNGEVVHGRSYWVTVTNGLLPEGMYRFADDGRMIID